MPPASQAQPPATGNTGATPVLSASSKPAFIPLKPKMGGLITINATTTVAWTGGIPDVTWTGLVYPAKVEESLIPSQYRPHTVMEKAQYYQKRIEGLKTPLTDASELLAFTRSVRTHLSNHGLDTIAYLPDPTDPKVMTNVLVEYAKFSVASCKAAVAHQRTLYDAYDIANDMAATQFLIASLSSSVLLHLYPRLDLDCDRCTEPFPVVWCRLMQEIQPKSFAMFQALKDRIRALHPSQFPGDNVKDMMYQFRILAEELDSAGHYEHSLSLNVLDKALLAGGDNPPKSMFSFHTPLFMLRVSVSQELLSAQIKPAADAKTQLANAGLTYKDIADTVTDRYTLLKTTGQWPPALLPTNRSAPPSAYPVPPSPFTLEQLQSAVVQLLQQQSAPLSGSAPRMTPQNSPCSNCGLLGHWKADCPKLQASRNNNSSGRGSKGGRSGRGGSSGRGDRGGRGGGRGRGRSNSRRAPGPDSWKSKPPAPGAPTTQSVNGKTFYWCSKCNRWSTTHSTATHRSNSGAPQQPQAALTWCAEIPQYGAFACECTVNDPSPSWSSWLFWLMSLSPMAWFMYYPDMWPTFVSMLFTTLADLRALPTLLWTWLTHAIEQHPQVCLLLAWLLGLWIMSIWICTIRPFDSWDPRWHRRGHLYPPKRRFAQRHATQCSLSRRLRLSDPFPYWVRRFKAMLRRPPHSVLSCLSRLVSAPVLGLLLLWKLSFAINLQLLYALEILLRVLLEASIRRRAPPYGRSPGRRFSGGGDSPSASRSSPLGRKLAAPLTHRSNLRVTPLWSPFLQRCLLAVLLRSLTLGHLPYLLLNPSTSYLPPSWSPLQLLRRLSTVSKKSTTPSLERNPGIASSGTPVQPSQ